METRQKQSGPADDVSLTPTRRSTRFNRVDQDGGEMISCAKQVAKQKSVTPKRCAKVLTEVCSSESGGDGVCTTRMTRSRGKAAATSPHDSSRKHIKHSAGVRGQTHAYTPPRVTRHSSRVKVDAEESARKMANYSSDVDTSGKHESPVKSAADVSHRDGEVCDESPSRRTRARPAVKGRPSVFDQKERHVPASSLAESNSSYVDDTNGTSNTIPKSSPSLNKPNSKVNICKPNSKLNTKSVNDIKIRSNSEENCKSDCPKRSSEVNERETAQTSIKQTAHDSPRDRGTGEIGKDKSRTRQTKRCIIFTDNDESKVKDDSESTSVSETVSSFSPLPPAFKSSAVNTEDEHDTDALSACDKRIVTTRYSKQAVSKNTISSSDEEPITDSKSNLHNIFTTSRRSPRLMNKYGNGFAKNPDLEHLQESRNSNLLTKRSSKCSSDKEIILGTTNKLVNRYLSLPEHQSCEGLVSLLQHKPDAVVTTSSESSSLPITEFNNQSDIKTNFPDANISNIVECSKEKQKRTNELKTAPVRLNGNEPCSGNDNVTSTEDLPICCEPTLCVATCKTNASNKCAINSRLSLASSLGQVRRMSENNTCSESCDLLDSQSCEGNIMQNSIRFDLNFDSSEEQTDVSCESDDETRYNVNDFVSRRRRLRSESQDNELWEGLPTSVRYRKSVTRCRQITFTDEDETYISPRLITDGVNDMDQYQKSTCSIINSSTNLHPVNKYQEKSLISGIRCKNEDGGILLKTEEYSGSNTEHSEIKMVTPAAKLKDSDPACESSAKRLDYVSPSKGLSRPLDDDNTRVQAQSADIAGADTCLIRQQTSTSQKSRNNMKELEFMSLSKTAIPTRVTEEVLQTDNTNDVKTTSCTTTGSLPSLQENNTLQAALVTNPLKCSTDQVEDTYNLKSENKNPGANLCSIVKKETPKVVITSVNRPCTRNRRAKSGSNHNQSSDTSGNQTISKDNIVANKSSTFVAPLSKHCPSTKHRNHITADEVETKTELSNPLSRYALKNTPRPTSSHSAPWVYDIQKINSDCQASPILNCRSRARLKTCIQSSAHIDCKSRVTPTDSSMLSPTLNCSSQIKSTTTSHPATSLESQTSTKTARLNTICSSSDVHVSKTKSNQHTKTSLSLLSNCSKNSEGQKSIEPNKFIHESSVKIVNAVLDGKTLNIKGNNSYLTANEQTSEKIVTPSFAERQEKPVETVSVLQEESLSPCIINAKLNQKSKFPKVVLTPLKRSQRLLEKYGSESPLREFKIKHKKKKSEDSVPVVAVQCETGNTSRNTKETCSDPKQPAEIVCEGGSDQKKTQTVRKNRRKQDLLRHQRVDTADDLQDTPLPKFRKKSHTHDYTLSQDYEELNERIQKIKDGEKRKSKKGKYKQRSNANVSTSSNMFGLRRKRGPAVDEELLANPLYNKHACVLWSSEHRRHYHLIHPEADFSELDNILRKHWEELLPSEKMRYFNRARDAVLDEFKHSKKPGNGSKQKVRSKENDANITPMEKFCQLNAKRQKELLSKWLYFYQKVLSCRDYKWFIFDVQRTLHSIQSLQKGEHKPLTSRKLEHRKLLFEKINKVKPRVISQYMERCRNTSRSHDLRQKTVIQNLIRGVPQNFPKGYRAKCVTAVLEDLRELESRSLLNVVGIPKCTPSYTSVFKAVTETGRPSEDGCTTSSASSCGGSKGRGKTRDSVANSNIVSDTASQGSIGLSPLQDVSDNDYANKLLDELHTVTELPVLEANVVDSVFTDLVSSKLEHPVSAASSSSYNSTQTKATATERAETETTIASTRSEIATTETAKPTAPITSVEAAATNTVSVTSTADKCVSATTEVQATTESVSKVGSFVVKALHKEATDAFERSVSGNGETCCELDSPSCILSTWLVADRVSKQSEHTETN